MSTQPNAAAPFVPPELRDVLQAFRREIFSSLRCAMPGIIQTFDPVTQTATIQVAMQMTVGDQVKDYPLLVDCPVAILSGGTAYLTFPIQPGDTCLVLFCDRAIDAWFTTGNVVPPDQQRAHSLADGIALVGIRNKANPIPNYSTTAVELRHADGAKWSLDTGVAGMLSGAGGQVNLDDKVQIKNDDMSLKTILDDLMQALREWVDTRGDTPNAETILALNNVSSEIDELIKI